MGTRRRRTRVFTTGATSAGTISGAAPSGRGRSNDDSTASIRHTGRKIRPACGAARSNAIISGCPRTARSCDP